MGKQIWWVLRSYLSNKVFLATLPGMGLWALFVMAYLLTAKTTYKTNFPDPPRGSCVVNTPDSLAHVRQAKLQDQVDYLQLGGIWRGTKRQQENNVAKAAKAPLQVTPPPESFYDVLDEFPNLRIVYADMFNVDSRPALRRLAGRREIEFLSLSGAAPLDMAAVARLPSLKRLELTAHEPVHDIKKLASLANLETLVFTSEGGVDDAVLRDIAQLPRLQTLVIRWNYFNRGITDAGIKQLDQSPSLKTFYVGGQRVPPEANLIVRGRALLTNVEVQPAVVQRKLPWIAALVPAIFAGGVGFVVAQQFRSPASRVTPAFAFPHAIVAVGWLCAVILTMSLCMGIAQQPTARSISLCGAAAMFGFSTGVDGVNKRRLGVAARSTPWEWFLLLVTLAFIISIALPRASEFAGQLQFVIVAGAVAFVAAAVWHTVAVLRELPAGGPNEILSAAGIAALQFMPGPHATLRRELLVESWTGRPMFWNPWARIQRWRTGNPPLPSIRFILMSAAGAGAVLVPLNRVPGAAASGSLVAVLSLIMFLMVCGQIATVWRKRLTCLDVESLRPISRSMLQRDWAIALALDLFVPAILVGLVSAVALQLRGDWRSSEAWRLLVSNWREILVSFAILSATSWVVTIAVTSLATIIERAWLRVVVLLTTLTASGAAFGLLLALSTDLPRRAIEPAQILPLLWVPTVVSLIVIACMWWLWTRIEFDRRS